ncbi:MAG: hypothetical protein QXW40_05460 [Thermofilum sp.]
MRLLPIPGDMYLYIGVVDVGGLRGYMWFLGRRLYLKLGWRPRDTVFLGNLSDPLAVAARLRRLLPRPVDERGCCPPPLALALDISIIYAKARPAALGEPEFLTRCIVLTAKCWGSYGGMGSIKSRGESTR